MKKKEILVIFVLILFLTILAAAGLKVFNKGRESRITITLKINPPNFAIVKWSFNTHQIGLEEKT